eukprot:TRINITY_DN62_c0_g1_i1.p1 TRINITY_DN62_c0_g1~~TRINITY_DN62_c0_g1_i1.p1  ORF type:complete len:963 (+),score=236.00 TRINITY_DN62_c0_g1_i1:48-2936(+)
MTDPNSRVNAGRDAPAAQSTLRANAAPYNPSFQPRFPGVPSHPSGPHFPGAHGGFMPMHSPRQYTMPSAAHAHTRPATTVAAAPVTAQPKKILSIFNPDTGIALVSPDTNPADLASPVAAKPTASATSATSAASATSTRVSQPAIITQPPSAVLQITEAKPETQSAPESASQEQSALTEAKDVAPEKAAVEPSPSASSSSPSEAASPSPAEVPSVVEQKQEETVVVPSTEIQEENKVVEAESADPQPTPAEAPAPPASRTALAPGEKPKYTLEFLLGLKDKFKEATPAIKELIVKIDTSAVLSPAPRNSSLPNKSNAFYGRPGTRAPAQRSNSSNTNSSHHNHGSNRGHGHSHGHGHNQSGNAGGHTPRDGPRSTHPPLARVAKDLSEEQKILADAKSLLNKLAPQTFEKLFKKFLELSLKTPDILKGVIKILFDMALNQGIFCPMYAQFCRELNRNLPKFEGEYAGQTFLKILLNTCQEEFEREKQPAPEGLNPTESWEFELKRRKRQIGNIRFIGEIYKIKMLPDVIIEECIGTLISQSEMDTQNGIEIDPESVECLCQLLVNIGSQFSEPVKQEDKESNKELIEHAFDHLDRIKTSPKTESRIRFMIMDTVDVRSNNWVSRRQENKPKTIEEVRKEALEEQLASIENAKSLPPPPPSKSDGRGNAPRTMKQYDMNRSADANPGLRPTWRGDNKRSSKPSSSASGSSNSRSNTSSQPAVVVRTTQPVAATATAPSAPQGSAVTSSLTSSVAQVSPYVSLTVDALIKRMRGVVEEFVVNGESGELIETLGAMSKHKEGKMVCFKMYELIGTCKDADREKLITAFTMIMEKKVWSDEIFFEGTTHFVSNLDDLKCDSPRIIQLTCGMYARWIISGLLPLSLLFSAEGIFPKMDKSGIYSAVIVEYLCSLFKAIKETSAESFAKLTSGLEVQAKDYLPEDDDYCLTEAKKIVAEANIDLIKLD